MTDNEPSTKSLDHLVHLSPPGSVEETSRQFQELGFKVIPGGTHSDGLTANALVVLEDGVYFELISFTYPVSHYPSGSPERSKREKHRWGAKQPGWVDFAFLGNGSQEVRISDIINNRATQNGSGSPLYLSETPGGRARPDGVILKWLITAPVDSENTGTLPFFCGDVTDRRLRVPSDPPSNTEHPSGATGIAHIHVLVHSSSYEVISRQISYVVGSDPTISSHSTRAWNLETLHSKHSCRLLLSIASSPEESSLVSQNGVGIYEVGVYTTKKGKEPVTTPYGRIIWEEI